MNSPLAAAVVEVAEPADLAVNSREPIARLPNLLALLRRQQQSLAKAQTTAPTVVRERIIPTYGRHEAN